jgi:hypothetical protein
MDKGSGLLTSNISFRPKAQPRLRLLVEWESPPRVFWRNLIDFLLLRTTPVIKTSRLAPFWKDVFVDSRLPWWGLLESLLWHLLAVTAVWIFSQAWVSPKHFQERITSPSHISYYTPPPSFPALGGNPSRIRARPPEKNYLAHRRTGSAAPQPTSPRPLKVAKSARPIPPPSSLRSSDLRSLQLPTTSGLGSIVAPSPAVSQTTSRPLVPPPQGSVVAPPPSVEAVSARQGLPGATAAIVAPPPSVQVPMRGVGDINVAHSQVVAPAPVLPMREQRAISGMAQANLGNAGLTIVPPPPSVQRSGIEADGRGGSLPDRGWQVVPPPPSVQTGRDVRGSGRGAPLSGGVQVVPPPPSIQGAGNISGAARGGSLSGTSLQVVAPPPSIQGTGNFVGGGRAGSLTGGGGLQVVPPPPSIQGTGNSAGGVRGGSLPGSGLQVVPPPPSTQAASNPVGAGRVGSLPGTGMQAMPPSPSIQGAGSSVGIERDGSLTDAGPGAVEPSPLVHEAGNSVTPRRPSAGDAHPAVAPPPATENPLARVTGELSVRLIGLALSLPNSSYFANYEVFIAERRLKNAQSQFIKLVYESLPYQRRLSEYALNSAKVYKLRVRRDLSCDESLLQMTWPESDPHPGSQNSSDSPGLTVNDRNNMLPCYRTTADDYRRALSHGR